MVVFSGSALEVDKKMYLYYTSVVYQKVNPENIHKKSRQANLFPVHPESPDLHKGFQVVSVYALLLRNPSVSLRKKQKVDQKQHIQHKKEPFLFCRIFCFALLLTAHRQIRISDFLFKSLAPLMIIRIPAAALVTRVTMPTARLQAPVLVIVL